MVSVLREGPLVLFSHATTEQGLLIWLIHLCSYYYLIVAISDIHNSEYFASHFVCHLDMQG